MGARAQAEDAMGGAQGFLDLENLLGDFHDTAPAVLGRRLQELVAGLRERFPGITLTGCGDSRLVSLLHRALPDLAGVRMFPGECGPDRADDELVARLRVNVRPGCEVVVIGSGDHAFAEVGRELREAGRHVVFVARDRSVSYTLWPAADEVIVLDALPVAPTATAWEVAA